MGLLEPVIGSGHGRLLLSDPLSPMGVFPMGFRFGSRTEEPNGERQREGPLTRSQGPKNPWQR